jgi:hypothetical protein
LAILSSNSLLFSLFVAPVLHKISETVRRITDLGSTRREV